VFVPVSIVCFMLYWLLDRDAKCVPSCRFLSIMVLAVLMHVCAVSDEKLWSIDLLFQENTNLTTSSVPNTELPWHALCDGRFLTCWFMTVADIRLYAPCYYIYAGGRNLKRGKGTQTLLFCLCCCSTYIKRQLCYNHLHSGLLSHSAVIAPRCIIGWNLTLLTSIGSL
jgi:hypothetical protein